MEIFIAALILIIAIWLFLLSIKYWPITILLFAAVIWIFSSIGAEI